MVQDSTDLIGRRIGSYRIEEIIGAGGYARVYKAVDDTIGRQTAIKVLMPGRKADGTAGGYSEQIVGRFEREARILAKLRDPHSVQMYEFGRTDDGLLYMIFEFIEGRTLAEVRRREAPLAPLRVVRILEQVLLSLEEAHALGLVHRDIKPQNIMVFEHIGRRDQVKVLDFGVGKSFASEFTADLTADGMLIGTPRYMAPEQWSSDGDITPATDIYALGHVAYELLVGSRAIEAKEPVHIMRAHLEPSAFELPEALDIPSGLRRVVDRMMAKDPTVRYRSAGQVLADLSRLGPAGAAADTMDLDGRALHQAEATIETSTSPFDGPADAVPAPASLAETERRRDETTATTRQRGGKPLAAVVIAALLVALAAVGYVVATGDTEADEAGAAAASQRPDEPLEPAGAAHSTSDEPATGAGKAAHAEPEDEEAAQPEEAETADLPPGDEPVAEASEPADTQPASDAPIEPIEPVAAPAERAAATPEPIGRQRPRRQEKPDEPSPDPKPSSEGGEMNIFTLD